MGLECIIKAASKFSVCLSFLYRFVYSFVYSFIFLTLLYLISFPSFNGFIDLIHN